MSKPYGVYLVCIITGRESLVTRHRWEWSARLAIEGMSRVISPGFYLTVKED